MGDNVPQQQQPEDPANWLVEWGVDILREMAGPWLHRQEAVELIRFWRHHPAMTAAEVAEVVDRFPVRQPVPEHEGLKIGTRHPQQ